MFTIIVGTTFTADHGLTDRTGKTEQPHSHNWTVTAAVCTPKLDKTGIAIDFEVLKTALEKITAALDGSRLEHLPAFTGINVSAENLAKYIYDRLEPALPASVKLKYIELEEQPGCRVNYCR